jgi:hypothetical protein
VLHGPSEIASFVDEGHEIIERLQL